MNLPAYRVAMIATHLHYRQQCVFWKLLSKESPVCLFTVEAAGSNYIIRRIFVCRREAYHLDAPSHVTQMQQPLMSAWPSGTSMQI